MKSNFKTNQRASIPSITCQICGKSKSYQHYTSASLNNNRAKGSKRENVPPRGVTCIACSTALGPRLEVQCSLCDKWKLRDKFSKNALKRGDDAICWACQKEVDSMEPIGPDSYDDYEVDGKTAGDDDADSDSECESDDACIVLQRPPARALRSDWESSLQGGHRPLALASHSSSEMSHTATSNKLDDSSTRAGDDLVSRSATSVTSYQVMKPAGGSKNFERHGHSLRDLRAALDDIEAESD